MKAYHESWERELDRQFLKNDRYRKRAYICSPLSGSTAEEELSTPDVAEFFFRRAPAQR